MIDITALKKFSFSILIYLEYLQIDSSQVDSTFTTLKKLEAAVSKKGATTTEFGSIVKEILEYME